MAIRLNKLLSVYGIASRRAADGLIAQGRVELNGRVVTELGTKADPDTDEIKVDGRDDVFLRLGVEQLCQRLRRHRFRRREDERFDDGLELRH